MGAIGGLSYLSDLYGLVCDNVVNFEVREAPAENPPYFFLALTRDPIGVGRHREGKCCKRKCNIQFGSILVIEGRS